jgi:hypothetical protein
VKMIHLSTIQTRDNDQGKTLLVCATSFLLFSNQLFIDNHLQYWIPSTKGT